MISSILLIFVQNTGHNILSYPTNTQSNELQILPMMKIKQQEQNLNRFILSVINCKMFADNIAPLLSVDTTALPTLRQIHQQTTNDLTREGKILNQSSNKLIIVMDKIRNQHRYHKNGRYQPIFMKHIPKVQKKRHQTTKIEKKKYQTQYFHQQKLNDENINTSNVQHIISHPIKAHQPKAKTINLQLSQIIRPEYKKKFNNEQLKYPWHQQDYNNFKFRDQNLVNRPNNGFITQSESSDDMPIIRNTMKTPRVEAMRNRSVSPKIQNQKKIIHLNNISSISKQSQTDLSLQIDLRDMGLTSQSQKGQKPNEFMRQFLLSKKLPPRNSQNNENGRRSSLYRRTQRIQSEQIRQQEPWECDEEEIEEQLRQINERLSHRAHHHQITQKDHQVNYYKNVEQFIELPRKKQPKTVRLSLTPVKSKSNNKSLGKKRQPKAIQINRTPVREKSQKPYKINCLIQKQQQVNIPHQFECSKWKKPQRNLMTVEIHKFVKNN